MLTKKVLRNLTDEELEQKLRVGFASILDATTGSNYISTKWVNGLKNALLDFEQLVQENERRLRPPTIVDLAKQALTELQKGNIVIAFALREQVISSKRYMKSKTAMPLISRFDDLRTERAIDLLKQAQIAAQRCDVEQVTSLLNDVKSLNSSMEANVKYQELQQMLDIVKSAETALKAADEAAGELYLSTAVAKIIEAAQLLNGHVHSLLSNVRADYATKRNQLMELLDYQAREALKEQRLTDAENIAKQMIQVDEDNVLNLDLRDAISQAAATAA